MSTLSPSAVCLQCGQGRQLSRSAALIAACHWLNAPLFPSHAKRGHYNDEGERQRKRERMRGDDGMEEKSL